MRVRVRVRVLVRVRVRVNVCVCVCHRVAGILSVHLQKLVHGLTAASFQRNGGLSRQEAGDPILWEPMVAAAAAGFSGLDGLS